jgi:thioredoxin 1
MKKKLILLTAILLIGAGCNNTQVQETKTDNMKPKVQNNPKIQQIEKTNTNTGTYTQYDESLLAMAEEKNVVLFFKASWCPTCRALDKDLKKNMDNIPEDVLILELDYDKEIELRQKYGVTVQHTLIQVNKDGEKIKKWTGSLNLENFLSKLK